MASSFSKTILVGNLGRDPEVRFTPSGKAVASFSVATSERWNDGSGNPQERTEWHNIVVWGKQAENCGQYLAKGRSVLIEGQIRYEKYMDKNGVEKTATKIHAQSVKFLGGGNGQGGGGRQQRSEADDDEAFGGGFPGGGIPDDDVPF